MMKKTFLIVSMLVLVTAVATAQGKREADVAAAVATLIRAMEDGDLKTLSALTADQLTYGHSSGKTEDKAEFLKAFETGSSDFVKIQIINQQIRVFKRTAIVRHMLEADTNDYNKPGHVRLSILTVWEKQHGKWILIARQAVKPAL